MFMQTSDLHCTATVSERADTEFEKNWFQEGKESNFMTSDRIYWNIKMCALTVGAQ